MYNSRWRNSHKEAGYKYGSMLYKNGKNIDFDKQLDEEKLNYGREVYPIYVKYFPEIIEEIR